MTPRANQIQSMIADIDKLLAHKGKRLWGVSSQEEPRQVLQRIRDFLANEASSSNETSSQAQLPPLVAKFIGEGNQDFEESRKPQSLGNDFAELIEPLKAELKMLLEERANLVSEIRELEKKRLHDYSLAQQLATQEKIISEFMQVLRSRLEDDIAGGVPIASVAGSGNVTTQKALSGSSNPGDSARVENLTKLTNDLDQRLVALDGTVNVVFEALQRNIHAYHDSLSQALARMHYKGVQGEQLLEGFIKNVANLSPERVNSELLQQSADDMTVETIDARSVEATNKIDRQLDNDFENVEDIESVVFTQESSDKLEVTPDETINNIEFSQAQDNSDFETAIKQLEEDSRNQDLDKELEEKLEQDNYLEVKFPEEDDEVEEQVEETIIIEPKVKQEIQPEITQEKQSEEEIEKEPDAFDTPERMEAVLNELKKPTVDNSVDMKEENANEDQVDELYASLFDSDIPRTSNPPVTSQVNTPIPLQEDNLLEEAETKQQKLGEEQSSQVINPETSSKSTSSSTEIESPLPQTQVEKEVISQEVVFEYTPESSTSNPSTVKDPQSNKNPKSQEINQEINPTTIRTYKRKTQVASEDTVTSLSELLFEEEVVTPPVENSQLKTEETTTAEVQQPQQLEPTVEPPKEKIQPKAKPQTQLEQITSPPTSVPQADQTREKNQKQTQKLDINTANIPLENPLPPTEKTIPSSEQENSSQNNSDRVISAEVPSRNKGETVWYLGLDLGTTGISAALLNRSTTEIHPIYWSQDSQTQAPTKNFRLPAEVYLPRTSINQDNGENSQQNIYSAYLKPYLPISLPYKSISETASTEVRQKWEPILQLNEFSAVPLVWIVRSLSKLLLTLKSDSNSTTLGLTATAIGISKEEFSDIINNIAGIICTCPSDWSEQYRFNIRESLLISQLVEHPQQVFFVEEAIATLMVELEGASGEIVKLINDENSAPIVTSDSQLIGNTLVINIGASATEMTLVDLPEDLQDLSHGEFMLHGFNCGGKAMEQDIITQLLLPTKWRKSRNGQPSDNTNTENNPLHWKPDIPGLEHIRFSSLGLEQLELPRAGEPDITQRICLQKRLESSPLGKALLDAAIALKLILQHQESFTIELADQRWELQRRDLESQVFVPFVRRINRELNKLLVARGIPTEAINQILLSGGVSSIAAISRWLQQKLPSAKIIQEKYLGESGTPACSRVATGLCVLPLHPLVLEIPRQQYTDYFLFTELLRLIPEKAITFGEIIQLFESRGINTRSCQQRLLAFLEGEIPPGLVPSTQNMQWLNQSSVENSNYKAISATPLFDKQGSLSYRPNLRQLQTLRNYLDAIQASAHQSLEEPYTVNFAVGVSE